MNKKLYYNRGKSENKHLNRNIEIFESIGLECRSFRFFPMFRIHQGDILYLNWYENIYNGNVLISLIQFVVKNISLFYASISKADIYSTQHNRCQHDAKHPWLSNRLYSRIYKLCKRIIVFCVDSIPDLESYIGKQEALSKAYFIPAVNYIGVYPYRTHQWINDMVENSCMRILMLGSLDNPYKNLEMVIDIAKELKNYEIQFILAGKISNLEQNKYFSHLIDKYNNIVGVFRYIEDDEISHLIEVSDVLIMPYDTTSMVNSGTARLAFSYSRTIICPEIPSLESIPKDLVFMYSYSDEDDHRKKLKSSIHSAYSIFLSNKDELRNRGKILKHIMECNNSPVAIREKYRELFYNPD